MKSMQNVHITEAKSFSESWPNDLNHVIAVFELLKAIEGPHMITDEHTSTRKPLKFMHEIVVSLFFRLSITDYCDWSMVGSWRWKKLLSKRMTAMAKYFIKTKK